MSASRQVSGETLASGLELLGYFRGQMAAMADVRYSEILRAFGDKPFTNGEVRTLLGTSRQSTWTLLARMAELKLVERKRHTYRVSPFARDFVCALSWTMRSLLAGQELYHDADIQRMLGLAQTGLVGLFDRGKISQEELSFYQRKLAEARSKAASP